MNHVTSIKSRSTFHLPTYVFRTHPQTITISERTFFDVWYNIFPQQCLPKFRFMSSLSQIIPLGEGKRGKKRSRTLSVVTTRIRRPFSLLLRAYLTRPCNGGGDVGDGDGDIDGGGGGCNRRRRRTECRLPLPSPSPSPFTVIENNNCAIVRTQPSRKEKQERTWKNLLFF